MGSNPTIPRNKPKTAAINPLVMDFPTNTTTSVIPNNIREKYSGGPNLIANLARGGANNIKPITLNVPAINEPIADIETFSSVLDPIEINKEIIPGIIDEIPILCIAASFARGNTIIKGAEELRYKESDRISTIVSEFNKLGANIEESGNNLIIRGNKDLVVPENTVESFGDHRIAMSLAIMSLLSVGKVTILGSDCINTSFPTFKHELQQSTGLDL